MAARFSRNPAGQLIHRWRPAVPRDGDEIGRRRARFADVRAVRDPGICGPHVQAAVGRLQRTIGNQAVHALLLQRLGDDVGHVRRHR